MVNAVDGSLHQSTQLTNRIGVCTGSTWITDTGVTVGLESQIQEAIRSSDVSRKKFGRLRSVCIAAQQVCKPSLSILPTSSGAHPVGKGGGQPHSEGGPCSSQGGDGVAVEQCSASSILSVTLCLLAFAKNFMLFLWLMFARLDFASCPAFPGQNHPGQPAAPQ